MIAISIKIKWLKMDLNEILPKLGTEEIMIKIGELYGERAVFTTSLSAEDMVILDLIIKNGIHLEIATIDTGRLPQETYNLMDKVKNEMGVDLKVYFPDSTEVQNMVNERGVNLFYSSTENRHLCCNIRKVHPLGEILKGKSVWITGIRSEQTEAREKSGKVEFDPMRKIWKINPILDWTRMDVWNYINENGIPYNKLYDMNYKSIGCDPCTRSVGKNEPERSGRWWWEDGIKECGIHLPASEKTSFHYTINNRGDSAD